MKKLIYVMCFVVIVFFSGCVSRPLKVTDPSFVRQYGTYDYCGIKYTKQLRNNSCGTACLASVINYWGKSTSEKKLLTDFPVSPELGYSLNDLHDMATSYELMAYILDMRIDSQNKLFEHIRKGRPVICAVEYSRGIYSLYDFPVFGEIYRALVLAVGSKASHYVVVFGCKKGKLLIMDPAYGFQTQSWQEFEKCWAIKRYAALLCVKGG